MTLPLIAIDQAAALPWAELHYTAKKAIFRADVEVRLQPVEVEPGGDSDVLDLFVHSKVVGRVRQSVVRIQRDTGQLSLFERVEHKNQLLAYKRWTVEGCSLVEQRLELPTTAGGQPVPAELPLSDATWQGVSATRQNLPEALCGVEPVPFLEGTALLYTVGRFVTSGGTRARWVVPSSGRFVVVEATRATSAAEPLDDDSALEPSAPANRVSVGEAGTQPIAVLLQAVEAPELGIDSAGAEVELLGLKGDTLRLLVDPSSGAITQVDGRAPWLGRVRVTLSESR
jgi:hypothetical protein